MKGYDITRWKYISIRKVKIAARQSLYLLIVMVLLKYAVYDTNLCIADNCSNDKIDLIGKIDSSKVPNLESDRSCSEVNI